MVGSGCWLQGWLGCTACTGFVCTWKLRVHVLQVQAAAIERGITIYAARSIARPQIQHVIEVQEQKPIEEEGRSGDPEEPGEAD